MSLTSPQQPGTTLVKVKHNPVAAAALSTPQPHPPRSQHRPPALPRGDNAPGKLLVSLWCPTGSPGTAGKAAQHKDPEIRNMA